MISLPLLNDVQAAGLTPLELRATLMKKLSEFIPEPEVSVIVTEVRSLKVSVIGQVARPGRYEFRSWATVMDVLAMAGGLGEFAAKSRIAVFRPKGRVPPSGSPSTTRSSARRTTSRSTSSSAPETSFSCPESAAPAPRSLLSGNPPAQLRGRPDCQPPSFGRTSCRDAHMPRGTRGRRASKVGRTQDMLLTRRHRRWGQGLPGAAEERAGGSRRGRWAKGQPARRRCA